MGRRAGGGERGDEDEPMDEVALGVEPAIEDSPDSEPAADETETTLETATVDAGVGDVEAAASDDEATLSTYSRRGSQSRVAAATVSGEDLSAVMHRLTRALATVKGRRYTRDCGGPIDARRTLRESLCTGCAVLDITLTEWDPVSVRATLLVDVSRSALARTLATEPNALLLDEPLSSLDAPIRRRLRDELHDLFRSLAIPAMVVTHYQRTAMALGDRIAVLRDGALEQISSAAEVLRRPTSRFLADFTGNENVFQATIVNRADGIVTVCVGDTTQRANAEWTGGSAVTACIHPSRVRIRSQSAKSSSSDENTVRGTVDRWLNEGDEYRVVVGVNEDLALTATVAPPVFERHSIADGSNLHLGISPDAVHLIPASGE